MDSRSHVQRMRAAWNRLCPREDTVTEAVLNDLVTRWSEEHRRYHNLTHLAEVLDVLRHLPRGNAAAVRLAAFFHDAVYQPTVGGHGNEEASAALVEHLAPRCGFSPATVSEAARLVRMTASHAPDPDDAAGCALSDADLAILAAPPERYLDYAAGVRAEYAHVDVAAFAQGRAAVLRELAARDPLYSTQRGRHDFESRARTNIARELSMLTNSEDSQ